MVRCLFVLVWLALTACGFGTNVEDSPIDAAADPDGPADAPLIPDAPTGAWLAGYSYRKPIVITRGGTTTLADFPVGIVLASDPSLALHARTDGADLVVTAGDAMTRLDSELAGFTAATGALELWVRVPSLPPASTTVLYIYYGGPVAATDPTGVWTSRFKGVWHLSDLGTGARDSTSLAHHLGQAVVAAVPGHTAGRAGGARRHDGIDDRLEIADPSDGSLDVGTQSFSFAIWVHENGATGAYDGPFYKGGTSSGSPGFCFLLGSGEWEAKVHDGNEYDSASLGQQAQLTNQWVHLVAVVDRPAATMVAYVNGAPVYTEPLDITTTLSTAQDLRVGRGSAGESFLGITDEVRIYNGTLTPDWIATEHANLTTSGFIATGPEQPMP